MSRDETPPEILPVAPSDDSGLANAATSPADPEAEAREAEYEAFVWDNLRRNYIGNYLHGMLGMTGFRLINAPTFMPVYIHMISGSNTIVGLAQALQQVGGIISPIFGATAIEHRKKVMPAALWMGGLGRVQIVGMALAGWFLQGQSLVYAMLALLFLFGVFMGAQRVVFGMLMAKVIPLSRRGRLQAWRNATGGLIAAVLAWVAGKYIIEPDMFGHGYSVTFALAALLTTEGARAPQPAAKGALPGPREGFPGPDPLRPRVRPLPAGTDADDSQPNGGALLRHLRDLLDGPVRGCPRPVGPGLPGRGHRLESALGLSRGPDRIPPCVADLPDHLDRGHGDPAGPAQPGRHLPGLLRAWRLAVRLHDGQPDHDP